MRQRPEKESELRPADVRMYEGVRSEPDVDYQTEPSAIVEGIADDHQDAIPVIVVDTVEPADFIDWGGEQFALAGENPVHIAGSRSNRIRMVVTNLGPSAVYLTKSSVGNSFTGAPIPVNSVVEMRTNRDVYATCLVAGTALVGVVQEFVIDDDK